MTITPLSVQVTRSSCYSQLPLLSPTVKSCLEKRSLTEPRTGPNDPKETENPTQVTTVLTKESCDMFCDVIAYAEVCLAENQKKGDFLADLVKCAKKIRKCFIMAMPAFSGKIEFDFLQFYFALASYYLHECLVVKLVESEKEATGCLSSDQLHCYDDGELTYKTVEERQLHLANIGYFKVFSNTNIGEAWIKTILKYMKQMDANPQVRSKISMDANPQTDFEIPEILDDDSWLNS